jgi:hypothetical protein
MEGGRWHNLQGVQIMAIGQDTRKGNAGDVHQV